MPALFASSSTSTFNIFKRKNTHTHTHNTDREGEREYETGYLGCSTEYRNTHRPSTHISEQLHVAAEFSHFRRRRYGGWARGCRIKLALIGLSSPLGIWARLERRHLRATKMKWYEEREGRRRRWSESRHTGQQKHSKANQPTTTEPDSSWRSCPLLLVLQSMQNATGSLDFIKHGSRGPKDVPQPAQRTHDECTRS